MIDELHVRDVALIKDASMRPAPGLTVLTGETGAGKTALLSAVKLIAGERSDAGAVREGADALVVEARLYLDQGDPEGVVVSRRVDATGRGRVEIDGRMASVRELAQLAGSSIDLCGQHEHQRLLRSTTHAELLDAWGGAASEAARAGWDQALGEAREAAAALDKLEQRDAVAQDELEEAAFVLRRIDEVAPDAKEYEQLEEALPAAEHAEALLVAASSAHESLSGDEGITDRMASVIATLREASSYDSRLARIADALEGAQIDVEDLAGQLRSYRDQVELDPETLSSMQARMAELQGLMRAYGPRISDVLERRERARRVVEDAQAGDGRLKEARERVKGAEAALARAADTLDQCRNASAPRFAAAVTAQMAQLMMGGAELVVDVTRLPREQWGPGGPSSVEFLYRPGPGLTPRPLKRIASGGEVSRVMLACKVALGDADSVETLVFDEVDAGVGGATAKALAQVLARLAKTRQVIVVTHLAQVAVLAERHYLVTKTAGEPPRSTICEVSGEERVREVARMLSGDATEASLAHAREMLQEAQSH